MRPTKIQIPDALKSEVPHTPFGRVLAATPVVMAVVATMLAGLASSEMTRAQYDRSLAAQQQSKAGDQWSFFQAKRLRGAVQRNTADLLQNVAELRPLSTEALTAAAGELAPVLKSPAGQQALDCLQKVELPRIPTPPNLDPSLKAALEGLENLKTDSEMAALLAHVETGTLEQSVRAGRDQAQEFDAATKPINQVIDQLDSHLSKPGAITASPGSGPGAGASILRDFTAARLRLAALRYEVEARVNQGIANLYELQVRKSNISAERHHARSQQFFFGMLGAQAGVIISTFAIAARKRNLLWALAAVAGLIAVAFAVYVYLCT
jgi:hypothetical protein